MTAGPPSLRDVLALDHVDEDLFRAPLVYPDEMALYGGQLAAQALVAAGRTVGDDRSPHSMHLYYLRGGDAALPTEYRVLRDRDGRGFSARRVEVRQDGRMLATVACSFAVPGDGFDVQPDAAPAVDDLADLTDYPGPRLFGFESRLARGQESAPWPTRFLSHVVEDLPGDGLTQAAALAHLSDRSSGIGGIDVGTPLVPVSLDHSVWFHRPVRMSEWVLMDLVPRTLAGGRSWYTGTVHQAGTHVASLTQEILARPRPV